MKKNIFIPVLLMTLLVSQNIYANMCSNVVNFDGSGNGGVITLPPPSTGDGISETGNDPKGHPDLVFSDLKLRNSQGQVVTEVEYGEPVNFSYRVENIGYFEPEHDLYIHVWRSDGEKLDDRPDDMGDDEFDNDDLDPGEHVHGDENFNAPTKPHSNGYNFIVCAHYNQYRDNPDEALGCSDLFHFNVVQPNYLPQGNIDSVNCSSIRGWASDQSTSAPIDVHVYRADIKGNNKHYYSSFTADMWRSDVGEHGFVWDIPSGMKNGEAYTLYFYGINQPEGYNPLFGQTQISCANPKASLRPVYRFYSSSMRSHFYTLSEGEKNGLLNGGWRVEGVAFYAHYKSEQGAKPVYRFYRSQKGHFYTASSGEKNALVSNRDWRYEGVAFYAYTWRYPGTGPVYRMYSSQRQSHFFTKSWNEVENAKKIGYRYEGIGFYSY